MPASGKIGYSGHLPLSAVVERLGDRPVTHYQRVYKRLNIIKGGRMTRRAFIFVLSCGVQNLSIATNFRNIEN